jgi:2-oxoisovalerate dehydrogenase E1 component
MLGLRLAWVPVQSDEESLTSIHAIGSGPADDLVEVLAIHVAIGERITTGQVVAVIEAAKSVVDVVSGVEGIVAAIVAQKGERIRVGAPLIQLASDSTATATSKVSLRPTLLGREPNNKRVSTGGKRMSSDSSTATDGVPHMNGRPHSAFLSRPSVSFGSRVVRSEDIASTNEGWSAEDAISLTGVKSRHWVTPNQDVVALATIAANTLLKSIDIGEGRITCVVCSTTSPSEATPSISCRVAGKLADSGYLADDCHSFDINAACSGYLYGLRCAADYLQATGRGTVLLLTAEVLSGGADPKDFNTAFLFGDAATATLVTGTPLSKDALLVTRPLLRSKPDPQVALWSPFIGNGYIKMDGMTVAREANKAMSAILATVAAECGITPQELSFVVPHPGSIRILQSVSRRLEIDESKVLHTLADTGNTSSSSIPIALDRYWSALRPNEPIGLVAFGAGFTSAAAIAYRHVNDKGFAT